MSRYAREHPEQFEPGGRRFDPLFDKEEPELRPCAACGEPTRGHWCSDSCRRAEDGLSEEEAREIEDDEEDE